MAVEYRWANGQVGNLRALAHDLVDLRVNVIVASGAVRSALEAKAATSTIPIVISGGADPVRYALSFPVTFGMRHQHADPLVALRPDLILSHVTPTTAALQWCSLIDAICRPRSETRRSPISGAIGQSDCEHFELAA